MPTPTTESSKEKLCTKTVLRSRRDGEKIYSTYLALGTMQDHARPTRRGLLNPSLVQREAS